MAAEDYTLLNRSEIAATAIGTSPRGIQAFEDLQDAAFLNGPAASAAAQASADGAQQAANGAQSSADAAQASADTANSAANDAAAAAAGALAEAKKKVAQSAGPQFGATSGTASRASYTSFAAPTMSATYTQAEAQALADEVQRISQLLVALVTDLRGNKALTP